MIEDPGHDLNPEDGIIVHKMVTEFTRQNTSAVILV